MDKKFLIKSKYNSKTEYLKDIKKALKGMGFLNGLPLIQKMPEHVIYNRIYNQELDVAAWSTFIGSKGYTVICYPTCLGQREKKKVIGEIDVLYKAFAYTTNKNKELRLEKIPYGQKTRINDFIKKRNEWIRQENVCLRGQGVKGTVVYQKIRKSIAKIKPERKIWLGGLNSTSPTWDPFDLSLATIKKIIYTKK